MNEEEESILQNRKEAVQTSGIYLLFDGAVVVYVGKSADAETRVRTHFSSGKVFDSYSIIPCAPEDTDEMEIKYILEYLPKYNGVLPGCWKVGLTPVGKLTQPARSRKLAIPCVVFNNFVYIDISEIGVLVDKYK